MPGDILTSITDTQGVVGGSYQDGFGPAMRLYLNRTDRYAEPTSKRWPPIARDPEAQALLDTHPSMDGWH